MGLELRHAFRRVSEGIGNEKAKRTGFSLIQALAMDEINELLAKVQAIDGHHVFQLRYERNPKGAWHEGHILAVNDDHIVFSWAPGPFMSH